MLPVNVYIPGRPPTETTYGAYVVGIIDDKAAVLNFADLALLKEKAGQHSLRVKVHCNGRAPDLSELQQSAGVLDVIVDRLREEIRLCVFLPCCGAHDVQRGAGLLTHLLNDLKQPTRVLSGNPARYVTLH